MPEENPKGYLENNAQNQDISVLGYTLLPGMVDSSEEMEPRISSLLLLPALQDGQRKHKGIGSRIRDKDQQDTKIRIPKGISN